MPVGQFGADLRWTGSSTLPRLHQLPMNGPAARRARLARSFHQQLKEQLGGCQVERVGALLRCFGRPTSCAGACGMYWLSSTWVSIEFGQARHRRGHRSEVRDYFRSRRQTQHGRRGDGPPMFRGEFGRQRRSPLRQAATDCPDRIWLHLCCGVGPVGPRGARRTLAVGEIATRGSSRKEGLIEGNEWACSWRSDGPASSLAAQVRRQPCDIVSREGSDILGLHCDGIDVGSCRE